MAGINQSIYTFAQMEDSRRKALTPSRLSTYLAKDYDQSILDPANATGVLGEYQTPPLLAATPTKVLVPTTQKFIRDWELDGVNLRYFLNSPGTVNRQFTVTMDTSMKSSVNNTIVKLMMYKNGAYENGIEIDRKISTGADVGAIPVIGSFSASHNDYIEVYVETSLAGQLIFLRTAINILEVN